MKKRIWELDALRGLCVVCMLIVHLCFDLQAFGLITLGRGWLYRFFYAGWGGAFFFLISGISVTLGSRSVRRGLMVLGCALLVSAVTIAMDLLGLAPGMRIYFGALHCLGVCMLLWPLFGKLPQKLLGADRPHWHTGILAVSGVALVILGLYLDSLPRLPHNWLMVFGWKGTAGSGDYFPLFPNLGYFLLGAALGRLVYAKKESLFPNAPAGNPLIRFFCYCGTHALPIYLLHQPVVYALVAVLAMLLL